jgi:hypothetical protein
MLPIPEPADSSSFYLIRRISDTLAVAYSQRCPSANCESNDNISACPPEFLVNFYCSIRDWHLILKKNPTDS